MPDWGNEGRGSDWAENYARYLVPAFFNAWTAETLQRVQVRPGDTVLDVACGTGVVTLEVAQLAGPEGKVVGVDLDSNMLSVAERIRKARGLNNVSLREMNVSALQFRDKSFDRVTCQHGIMFFEDKPAAVREMYRVLASHGKMVITAWSNRSATPHDLALADAFHAVLGEEPPFFSKRFSVGERGDMEQILREAGVKEHAVVERVQRMAIFPSAEAYWQGMMYGRPLVDITNKLSEQELTAIKADVLNRLEPYKADKGYITPMEAVIATITKP